MSAALDVRVDDYAAPHSVALIAALAKELDERYGDEDPDYLEEVTAADLTPPNGVYVTAWLDGEPVGCGAVRRARHAERLGEIKRMYVVPPCRGSGLSRLLLESLEQHARQLGFVELVLETGTEQPEAMALYESSGWSSIDSYGKWADSPMSRCYGKLLW